jgi:hypothetical protein|tara:strand:- start:61 stop:534 length:474 start_codon:yes stop_codon:yes gene_type:complete
MSIAKEYEMRTLRLSNTPGSLLIKNQTGKFECRIPETLRNKPCNVHIQSGFVANLNNIFPVGVDTHVCFIRSNLATNSYDVTTNGGNQMLGSIVRANNNEKAGVLDLVGVSHFGSCILPPTITIELMGVVTATGELTPLSGAASIVEVVLGLEFLKE